MSSCVQEFNQNSIFSQAYGKNQPPGSKTDGPMMHQEPSLYSLFDGTPWSPSLPASSGTSYPRSGTVLCSVPDSNSTGISSVFCVDHSTPASQSPHSSNPSSLPSSPPTHNHGALPFSNFGPIGTPDNRDRRLVDRWKADKTGKGTREGGGRRGPRVPKGSGVVQGWVERLGTRGLIGGGGVYLVLQTLMFPVWRCRHHQWVGSGLPSSRSLLCSFRNQLAPNWTQRQLMDQSGVSNGGVIHRAARQPEGQLTFHPVVTHVFQIFGSFLLKFQPRAHVAVLALTLLYSSAVHLVQLHDAAWPVGAGTAPPAAEAEAATRSRRHESASLNAGPGGALCPNQTESPPGEMGGKTRSLTKTSSD